MDYLLWITGALRAPRGRVLCSSIMGVSLGAVVPPREPRFDSPNPERLLEGGAERERS